MHQKVYCLFVQLSQDCCIADLADNENIIEVHVMGAELQCATGANFASFVELNFFEHATQATPVIQGRRQVAPFPNIACTACTIPAHLIKHSKSAKQH